MRNLVPAEGAESQNPSAHKRIVTTQQKQPQRCHDLSLVSFVPLPHWNHPRPCTGLQSPCPAPTWDTEPLLQSPRAGHLHCTHVGAEHTPFGSAGRKVFIEILAWTGDIWGGHILGGQGVTTRSGFQAPQSPASWRIRASTHQRAQTRAGGAATEDRKLLGCPESQG